MNQAAIRYSETFYLMMADADLLKEAQRDCEMIMRLNTVDPRLNDHLGSQVLSSAKKLSLLDKLFGDRLHRHTYKFIRFMLHKHRGELIGEMVDGFLALAKERSSTLSAELRVPMPLSESCTKEIRVFFEKHLGKTLIIETVVDDALLGGFALRAGDLFYDFSLHGQIGRLRSALYDHQG